MTYTDRAIEQIRAALADPSIHDDDMRALLDELDRLRDAIKAPDRRPILTGAEKDTLIALVEQGPLWDGDVPSKQGRDALVRRGLAAQIMVKSDDGWQAATYAGRDAYRALFPGPDGPADTTNEAKANRFTRRAINSARSRP
jgi:hypothetical protein